MNSGVTGKYNHTTPCCNALEIDPGLKMFRFLLYLEELRCLGGMASPISFTILNEEKPPVFGCLHEKCLVSMAYSPREFLLPKV